MFYLCPSSASCVCVAFFLSVFSFFFWLVAADWESHFQKTNLWISGDCQDHQKLSYEMQPDFSSSCEILSFSWWQFLSYSWEEEQFHLLRLSAVQNQVDEKSLKYFHGCNWICLILRLTLPCTPSAEFKDCKLQVKVKNNLVTFLMCIVAMFGSFSRWG